MPFVMLMSELKSKRIVLPRGYALTEELQRLYPEIKLILTDTEEQSMLMVAGNRADVTALNLASAAYIVHMRGLANLRFPDSRSGNFF